MISYKYSALSKDGVKVKGVIDAVDEYDGTSYKIFVYAENQKLKLLQVDGDDGNGYYGTGYSIIVKIKE